MKTLNLKEEGEEGEEDTPPSSAPEEKENTGTNSEDPQ